MRRRPFGRRGPAQAMHDAGATVAWLRVAAQERLTFHGLLARRILRMDSSLQAGVGNC